MLRRLALVILGLTLTSVTAAADGPTLMLATPTAATCAVSGTATFSPGINIVPQAIAVTINVGGGCIGSPLGDSVTLSINGSPLQSCEGGFGPTATSVFFTANPPGSWNGTGDLVVGPASGVATVTAGVVIGTLTYVWTGSASNCTAPSGVTSTPVTGLFTYVST